MDSKILGSKMVEQQNESGGTRIRTVDLSYRQGGPLNTISINNVNSGVAENGQEIDESRSSTSPTDHMDGDEENMSEGYNLIPEQDRFLPIANIGRIMKRAVPIHGKIAKEAKECVQECISEFISFLTSEASDKCLHEKRKTITVEDMINAMRTLDLGEYADVLTIYMKRFREAHRGRGDQLSGSGAFGETLTEELQQSIHIEPSSRTVSTTNGVNVSATSDVGDAYQSVNISGTGGTEPVVRVLPANAQVLLDASGNHYLTWHSPEGTQIVQVQAASTIDASAVPLARNEVAFVSTESTSTTVVNHTPVTTNPITSSTEQNRTFRQSLQFRSVTEPEPNEVVQNHQMSHNSVTNSINANSVRFARPAAATMNNLIPVKRSRDEKGPFLRT